MTLHPFTSIFIWLVFVLATQKSAVEWLPIFVLVALLAAVIFNAQRWLIMLRRTRWLSFSLLVIYAYATSGEALWPSLAEWSPTKEGLLDGFIQLGRVHCALAALSILLSRLSQQQLMAGLYVAAFPLRFVAISRERLVVRIALTLSYAENTMNNLKLHSLSDFRALFDREDRPAETIELPMSRLHSLDILVLIIALGLLIGIMR
jgi:energy-coupling factor transport system permease protein